MVKEKLNLSVEEIQKIQKELVELGVLEEFRDYRITEEYLKELLEKYSDFVVVQIHLVLEGLGVIINHDPAHKGL